MEIKDYLSKDYRDESKDSKSSVRKFLNQYKDKGIKYTINKKDGLKISIQFDSKKPFGMQLGILSLLPFFPKNKSGNIVIEIKNNKKYNFFMEVGYLKTIIYASTVHEFNSFSEALNFTYKNFSYDV